MVKEHAVSLCSVPYVGRYPIRQIEFFLYIFHPSCANIEEETELPITDHNDGSCNVERDGRSGCVELARRSDGDLRKLLYTFFSF
jgi:hypothetical protein